MDGGVPAQVLAAVVDQPGAELLSCRGEPITTGSGAATSAVLRLTGTARCTGVEVPFRLVRKELRAVTDGPHAAYADDPRHWTYWRREPLAYVSGLLPTGPGLAAPRCYGVVDDVIYLADIDGEPESPCVAARRLGAWQATSVVPDVPWLSGHQVAQRVALSELDWSAVAADARIAELWDRRDELLERLACLPTVLTHGDFSAGNLIATASSTTTVLDWATLGVSPIGADPASLALSALVDVLDDFLIGLDARFDPTDVEMGYRVALALTGASRVHWMLARGMRLPAGYDEFVLSHAP